MHGTPLYAPGYTHFIYANPAAPKGGALRLAKAGSFDNLNDLVITGTPAEGLENVNDRLMQRAWGEPFTLYGLVAREVEVAPDRSWIVFRLDPRARFHDGTPMTAEDVAFTFEAFKTHGHPVRRRVYGLVSKVEILNPREIRFTFGPGFDRESVMILGLMQVLPKHYWQAAGRDISKTTLTPPLGSGPYRIASVEPGRRIVYERVKDYWAKDLPPNKGQYNFDTVSYAYYRDDAIALEAFKGGDYDLRREYDVKKWRTGYEIPAIAEGKIVKAEIGHGRAEWLRAFIFNTRRAPFKSQATRYALSLLLDHEWANKNLYYGDLKPIESVFPNSLLAARDIPSPPMETRRERERAAISLLRQGGWRHQDGRLVDAEGKPMSIEILLGDPGDEKLALFYAGALLRLGIEAQVRTVDSAQFAGRLQDFDYDIVSYRWINSLSPGAEQLNYWGSEAAATPGSRNYAGVADPAVDKAARAIAAAPDYNTLVDKARDLDRLLIRGRYFVPLFYGGKDRFAYASFLQRPEKTPLYGTVLETWWRAPQ